MRNLSSAGLFWYMSDKMNVFTATDFPEPVAQATSKWGIVSSGFHIGFPSIHIPNTRFVRFLLSASANQLVHIICLKRISSGCGFGISIPTTSVPGIGASILNDFVFNASVRSF